MKVNPPRETAIIKIKYNQNLILNANYSKEETKLG